MIIIIIIESLLIVLLGLYLTLFIRKKKKREQILENIDMSIIVLTIPECKELQMIFHPDKAIAANCKVGKCYEISQLIPGLEQSFSLFCKNKIYNVGDNLDSCNILITETGIMPSGDPMLEGVIQPLQI